MSDPPSRLVVVTCALLLLGLAGCRSQPPQITREIVTQEVTRLATEVVTIEAPPVEVTRIVEEVVEVTAVPSPTSPPQKPKTLTVCLVSEPTSLFLYDAPQFGGPALARQVIHHAIYENLYTTLSYEYQAQALEKLPNLEDQDAEIRNVAVQEGDVVVDVDDDVVELKDGVTIRDSDGNELAFDGTEVQMPQMVVRFTLRPMVWSDGEPVTAADSVFSFKVAANPITPGNKSVLERTADYQALDDLTVEWTGLPGYLDPTYFTNIWQPLPRHQLGDLAIVELPDSAAASRSPLSNGPFVIGEWIAGDHITLVKNEQYYRQSEGLPHLDMLNFKFVENRDELISLLLAGQCDIGTQDGLDITSSAILLEAEKNSLLSTSFQVNNVFEHIDFGINPAEDYAESRPDWFEDVRVRQAMVMCTDRQAMVDEALLGLGQIAHAYVPTEHPLYPPDITEWPHDIDAANELLDQAGYRDRDGDGIREDPTAGQPFQVALGVNISSDLRQQIAQMFQQDMLDCGIDADVSPQAAAEWFAATGPLFGRRFDLALFPWITGISPACDLYTTTAIPSEASEWTGNNETGWSDAAYDAACASARAAFVGTDAYRESHQAALRMFSEQVPVIPLFFHAKVAAAGPSVRGFAPDPTQESELWNLYQIDVIP